MTALDGNRIYSILKKLNLDQAKKYTREDLVKVADEGRATYVASGSLMKAGESIVIMLTLQKPRTGEVIDSIKLTCQNEAEILPKTDETRGKDQIGPGPDAPPRSQATEAWRFRRSRLHRKP